jgi:hypothetical protein
VTTRPDATATLSVPKRILLLLLIGAVTLAASEMVVRAIRLPPGYFPFNQREASLYRSNPIRGYELQPGAHHQYVTPELSVAMDVTADGVRGESVSTAQHATYRILSIGDSFTFGLAVAAEDTWSAKLERLLREEYPGRRTGVVNGGVPGYGARQIRQRLEELLPLVKPDLIILGLTGETFSRMQDPLVLYDGMLIRSSVIPNLRIASKGILFSPLTSARGRSIDFWLNEHFQLGAHLLSAGSRLVDALRRRSRPPHSSAAVDSAAVRDSLVPMLDEVSTMHALAAQRNIPFLVLLIDAQRSDGTFDLTPQLPLSFYNGIILERCAAERMNCLDLLPELVGRAGGKPIFRTLHDQHWTPAAHQLAAEGLQRAIGHLNSPGLR